MSTYTITPDEAGITIVLAETGETQDALVAAFGECQAGECSCPTDEYQKVAGMELRAEPESIRIDLRATPGTAFDVSEIAACIDYTVEKAGTPTHDERSRSFRRHVLSVRTIEHDLE